MSDLPGRPGNTTSPAHIPVLLREVLSHLELEAGQIVVDGTVGAGGHSREILKVIGPSGTLIGVDRDWTMLEIARSGLTESNCHLVHASYAHLQHVLTSELHIPAVDRILLDLGLSSVQLADEERGFSFHAHGPLDLRFDVKRGMPAWELLARISEHDLADIIFRYGEEPQSRRIARHLVDWRSTRPIRTSRDLATAVAAASSSRQSQTAARHPATRVFQALRIEVNQELDQLGAALGGTTRGGTTLGGTTLPGVLQSCLKPGGIAVIISFHSLEDRIVKQAFRNQELWQILTPKPVSATIAEQRANPRSRTAKLRAARKK